MFSFAVRVMHPAGRNTRIIDPDGDDRPHYESSNNMPDLTDRLHEAKSSPEANRELMVRIRQSNIKLGDSRIKVIAFGLNPELSRTFILH